MNALLVFVILLFCRAEAKAPLPSTGFSIDLIHRDLSPLSPFYNSSMTPSERMRKAALRSISRFDENKAQTDARQGEYLMKFFIGSPPAEILALADTGSDLIWVPCLPCGNCNRQNAFDPAKSSTFKVESCSSQACNSLRIHSCGNSGQCRYNYSYGDHTYTIGDLATESLNFGSTNGQDVSFPESVFGCGHDNHDFGGPKSPPTGIVGLGRGTLSLVSQLGDQFGNKFSYCLSPNSSSSKLKFGSEATISGNGVVSTPIFSEKHPTYYYLNLEGISVGQKKIQTGKTNGNIVIDSGTEFTELKTSLYNKLRAAVVKAIGEEKVEDPTEGFDLCFTGSVQKFPAFVFHFTDADLTLQTENLFTWEDNLWCFTVVPTNGTSFFGNIAQINFQVEYDNEENKVSFAPADCTKH